MAASARWSDLRTRLLSALVMAPVALICILLGGVAFALMVALLAVGMAFEWLRMCRTSRSPAPVLMFAALPVAVALAALDHTGFALLLLILVTAVALVRQGAHDGHRLLPLGVPYVGVGAVALVWLRLAFEHGAALVIALLLIVWAGDIGAYVIGRAIGGRKLAPRISPGKTWSGAGGGLLASMAVGAGTAWWFGFGQDALPAALVAGLLGIVGQVGDLLESGLKRRFKVKDSGAVIPGHGGLLDRLDAVLTAAPAAAILALLLGGGVIHW